jgi:hypothetical protein
VGLLVTYTNVLIGQVPTITNQGAGEIPANLSDPDHSLNYTCGNASTDFTISYGPQNDISYVAISGHNGATGGPIMVVIYDGLDYVKLVLPVDRNNNLMISFDERNFSDLIIKFLPQPSDPPLRKETTVSFIAAGKHLDIEKGEQAGYKRLWLMRHLEQRTTTNMQSMPVSTLKKPKGLKGSLSLPNESTRFTETDWQDFIDFTLEQPFFIKEREDSSQSTYICFDAKHTISAHPQTRELNSVTLSFTAFNGL